MIMTMAILRNDNNVILIITRILVSGTTAVTLEYMSSRCPFDSYFMFYIDKQNKHLVHHTNMFENWPSLLHDMFGMGTPVALHSKTTVCPTSLVTLFEPRILCTGYATSVESEINTMWICV